MKGEKIVMNSSYGERNAIAEALSKYSDMVRRICFLYLKEKADVEDVFQEVFLQLLQKKIAFESEEHKKAWLCRVTINKCKDINKSFWKKNVFSIDDFELPFEDNTESDLMRALLSLEPKYKDVIYLFYYEGYSVPEIARFFKKNENTIYSSLHRARELLKKKLEG